LLFVALLAPRTVSGTENAAWGLLVGRASSPVIAANTNSKAWPAPDTKPLGLSHHHVSQKNIDPNTQPGPLTPAWWRLLPGFSDWKEKTHDHHRVNQPRIWPR
jgi:hypothetical protein